MNVHLTFTEQICELARSIGMQFRIVEDTGCVFGGVEISPVGRPVLVLKLIDLGRWVGSETAKNELFSYRVIQSEMRDRGITSVVLWEDLWQTKQKIIESRIKALLGISQRIPGRLTIVRRIDKQTASEFLNANHLQGAVSSKTQYGLYLPARYYRVLDPQVVSSLPPAEMLVAVATFSHPRIFQGENQSYRSYEMIRFSNLIDTTVVGGINKLINAFIKAFNPGDLMTYADLEWSDGASYRRLGFEEVSETEPILFWLDPLSMNRVSQKKMEGSVDEKISLYNLGSRKFVKNFSPKG